MQMNRNYCLCFLGDFFFNLFGINIKCVSVNVYKNRDTVLMKNGMRACYKCQSCCNNLITRTYTSSSDGNMKRCCT